MGDVYSSTGRNHWRKPYRTTSRRQTKNTGSCSLAGPGQNESLDERPSESLRCTESPKSPRRIRNHFTSPGTPYCTHQTFETITKSLFHNIISQNAIVFFIPTYVLDKLHCLFMHSGEDILQSYTKYLSLPWKTNEPHHSRRPGQRKKTKKKRRDSIVYRCPAGKSGEMGVHSPPRKRTEIRTEIGNSDRKKDSRPQPTKFVTAL